MENILEEKNENILEENNNLNEEELLKLSIEEFKNKLGKKVKDMNKDELNIYNKIKLQKKQDEFINLNIDKEKKLINNIEKNNEKFKENESNENSFIKLESLKNKFPDIFENITYDKQMTKETLETKHKIAMKLIEEKHSHHVAFSVFIMLTKCSENISEQYLNYKGLNGLTETTCEMKDEITDILKEMIDTGELPVEALTPSMRLAMIMSGCVIKTIEKNSIKNDVVESSKDSEVSSNGL